MDFSTITPGVTFLSSAVLVMATVTRLPGTKRLLSPMLKAETGVAGGTWITASPWQASALA